MGLPNIDITFSSTASTAVQRSGRGVVCLLLKDSTVTGVGEYTTEAQIETSKWTAANLRYIKEVLLGGCSKVYVVRLGNNGLDTTAKAVVDGIKYNWIASPEESVQAAIVTYVKGKNAEDLGRKVKAVVYNQTAPNDEHIVNFTNTTVTRVDGTAEAGSTYTPRLAGLLAGLPFTRSATYYELTDLEAVAEPTNADSDVDAGKFVIINDYGEVKVGRAVNSLTTETSGTSKSISVVEAKDLIFEDIYTTFKKTYVGKHKNKYSNQALFIAAVNKYFLDLTNEDVLDPEFDNVAEIDVEAQRSAWIDAGTAEAVDWDETTVKKHTYRTKMFLQGNIKILDAIEDLTFKIALV